MRKRMCIRFFLSVILVSLIILGCEKEKTSSVLTLQPPPIPEERRLPSDYVFILDNSGSIPPGESREIACEAIKAFIELAEPGDRISLITFDRDAEIIASETISDNASRSNLNEALDSGLTFQGQYTDISKGVNTLRENQQRIFRGSGRAKPVAILISDGRLEPSGNLQIAYNRVIEDWQVLSELIPFYTFGLGNTDIFREFLPGINGESLLSQMANGSGGRLYPVRSVEELVETYISLLRFTKGYGEISGKEVFWTDESTVRLVFLVIKRLPNHRLCSTQDIRLIDKGGRRIGFSEAQSYLENNSRISWRQSPYYDLILVEEPSAGDWRIALENGESPKVAVLIKHNIYLRYQVQKEYWDQEKKMVMSWLYDDRTGAVSERECRMYVKFDVKDAFQTTYSKINLQKTEEGTYLSALSLEGKEPEIGDYLIELYSEDKDSFFSRKSPVLPVKIRESYFSFDLPRGNIERWPILWKGLWFSVTFDTQHKAYPSFQDLPKVFLYLERLDEKRDCPLPVIELPCQSIEGKLLCQVTRKDLELGEYVAYIKMEGLLTSGREILIESPDSYFKLFRPICVLIILAVIGLIILIVLAFLFRPKFSGKLIFLEPLDKNPIILKGNKNIKKSIKGDTLEFGRRGEEMTELKQTSFVLSAKRGKGLKIEIRSGDVSLTREGETKLIKRSDLYREDILSFNDSGNEYKIEIITSKRLPRKTRR